MGWCQSHPEPHLVGFSPSSYNPSRGPMRTQRLSCPSQQGSISTSMETWMRTASMKVSESLRAVDTCKPGQGRAPITSGHPSLLSDPPALQNHEGLFSFWLTEWGFLFLTPSNPLTCSGHLLTSTELPRSCCRHVGLTDKCLSTLSPS